MTGKRATKHRVSTAGLFLNRRDAVVLRWVGEQRAVSLSLLAKLLGRESTRVVGPLGREALDSWLGRHAGAGRLVVDSVAGLRSVRLSRAAAKLLEVPYSETPVHLARLAHQSAVNEARFALEEEFLGLDWITERELLGRPFDRIAGENAKLADGAFVWTDPMDEGRTLRVAVEIELTRKSAPFVYANAMERTDSRFGSVWWFVPSESFARWLHSRVEGHGVPTEVRLLPLYDRRLFNVLGVTKP